MKPILDIQSASLEFGSRIVWRELSFSVAPGEFIAIIGANGSGKSMLLKSILGLNQLTSGKIELPGGISSIGYVPQHRAQDYGLPLKVKDLIRFGLDGHKFGLPLPTTKTKNLISQALKSVSAEHLANEPIGNLSGGELQRVRVAQAIIDSPELILADEPLSNLDLGQQTIVSELINHSRKRNNSAVLFVTHDVNPIIDYVDRVLYLANGSYQIGTPDEVLQSEVLSELYGTDIDVVRNQGRIVVLGTHDHAHHPDEEWK